MILTFILFRDSLMTKMKDMFDCRGGYYRLEVKAEAARIQGKLNVISHCFKRFYYIRFEKSKYQLSTLKNYMDFLFLNHT